MIVPINHFNNSKHVIFKWRNVVITDVLLDEDYINLIKSRKISK